jgi:hypothetical protein
MSELGHRPDPTTINKQHPAPTEERIQFSDRRVAFGFRTPGDRITWGEHKYTSHLDNRGGPDLAIVGTERGRRFALGKGVAVMLPEFSKEEGRFKAVDGQLSAKSVSEGIPDLTIGEPWELLGDDDRITDVVVDYTTMTESQKGAHQLDMPNPFDHAREILDEVAAKMENAGQY